MEWVAGEREWRDRSVVQETVTEIFRLTDRSVFSDVFMIELLTSYRVEFRSVCFPVGSKAVCETHCVKWLKTVDICIYFFSYILYIVWCYVTEIV
jgi:hypothetical protein